MRSRRKQILVDISTQWFFFKNPADFAHQQKVLANIRRLMAWARLKNIPVISTCQIYANSNGSSEGRYSIEGTPAIRKLRFTLLNDRIVFPPDSSMDMPCDVLRNYRQIILQERCPDPFEEPRSERLFTEVIANEFIIIGANAEDTVKATALGLLQRGKTVTIVTDAITWKDKIEASFAFRKMQAKGGHLAETRSIAGKSRLASPGLNRRHSLKLAQKN